ncbi:MAG: hypothetical protein IH618_01300 [Ignavibacteriaceae bacterium]|nr:hypothetical protein [Ignavibacteriaceae bacterium]
MMRFIKLFPIFFVIGIIGLIVSCEDDKTTNPQDQAPAIPPQSSMVINFDEFPDTASGSAPDNPLLLKRNWSWAAGNVAVWNSVLTLTLAVPVAAFVEAFNHQPVKQADGSWLWQFSVSIQEELFTAKLYGKTVTEGVEWKMLLTKQGAYTDFEWFTGFSNLPATEGTWTLNKDPNQVSPFLYIEWKRNTAEGTVDLKYTSIASGSLQNGSYIHYGKTNEIPHNRFYQIYGAEENRLIDIYWNYEQRFGRVKDAIYFEDSNWHCWDERLDDINCPE